MMKVFRWRSTLPLLLVVMVIGSCLVIGCTSKSTSFQPEPPSSTPKVIILTPTPPPTGTQGTVSSQQPYIRGGSIPFSYKKGQDITFNGEVVGGAESLTVVIYFICEDPMNCPNLGCERKGTCSSWYKWVAPINADSSFSSTVSTTNFKPGQYMAELRLPTGQNLFYAFIIENT